MGWSRGSGCGRTGFRSCAPAEPAKPACFTPKARPEFTEREKRAVFVHPAQLPNGKPIKLLKTLLSSACERDRYYCPFRAGRDFRRATLGGSTKTQNGIDRRRSVRQRVDLGGLAVTMPEKHLHISQITRLKRLSTASMTQ